MAVAGCLCPRRHASSVRAPARPQPRTHRTHCTRPALATCALSASSASPWHRRGAPLDLHRCPPRKVRWTPSFTGIGSVHDGMTGRLPVTARGHNSPLSSAPAPGPWASGCAMRALPWPATRPAASLPAPGRAWPGRRRCFVVHRGRGNGVFHPALGAINTLAQQTSSPIASPATVYWRHGASRNQSPITHALGI